MTIENLEKLPELIFVYSPKSEIASVLKTVERNSRSPYSKQGYEPRMPQGETLETTSDNDELFEKIKTEITPEKLALAEKYKEFIREVWPEIIAKLRRLLTEIGQPLPDSYEITFTDYGVGGRFGPPNQILIRFEDEAIMSGLKNVIIHEAIHNVLEIIIDDSYKDFRNLRDTHWVREMIVDHLMRKIVPETEPHYKAIKNLSPERLKQIEEIFNQHYPNVQAILQTLIEIK